MSRSWNTDFLYIRGLSDFLEQRSVFVRTYGSVLSLTVRIFSRYFGKIVEARNSAAHIRISRLVPSFCTGTVPR
jgi:hypothetical protein